MFWVVFAVVMLILFMVNRERISATIRNAPFPAWFLSKEQAGAAAPAAGTAQPQTSAAAPPVSVLNIPETLPPDPEPVHESESSAALEPGASIIEESVPIALQNFPDPGASEEITPPAATPQTLYFIRINPNGTILRSKVTRMARSSASPLLNTLQILADGPTSAEEEQGLISLIPEGTTVLSVSIRGETAYIDMSEEFQYNSYGREGYAAQLHQIVWTATEFPNVNNVQLLIEGRRVNWLSEGVWIGNPLNRTSL